MKTKVADPIASHGLLHVDLQRSCLWPVRWPFSASARLEAIFTFTAIKTSPCPNKQSLLGVSICLFSWNIGIARLYRGTYEFMLIAETLDIAIRSQCCCCS